MKGERHGQDRLPPDPHLGVGPDTANWWRTSRTPGEIGDSIAWILAEQQQTNRRLEEMEESRSQLEARYERVGAELVSERERFRNEIKRILSNRKTSPVDKSADRTTPQAAGESGGAAAPDHGTVEKAVEQRVRKLKAAWKQERDKMLQEMDSLKQELDTYRLTAGDF